MCPWPTTKWLPPPCSLRGGWDGALAGRAGLRGGPGRSGASVVVANWRCGVAPAPGRLAEPGGTARERAEESRAEPDTARSRRDDRLIARRRVGRVCGGGGIAGREGRMEAGTKPQGRRRRRRHRRTRRRPGTPGSAPGPMTEWALLRPGRPEGPADEPGCTPGSVPGGPRGPPGDGHPSRTGVATGLQRSTRGLGRAALERPRRSAGALPLDLAPGGVYLAAQVTLGTGGLLHHRFTLTEDRGPRRSAFCGTVPRVTPGGR